MSSLSRCALAALGLLLAADAAAARQPGTFCSRHRIRLRVDRLRVRVRTRGGHLGYWSRGLRG